MSEQSWLDKQAEASAKRLAETDPDLLGPAGKLLHLEASFMQPSYESDDE